MANSEKYLKKVLEELNKVNIIQSVSGQLLPRTEKQLEALGTKKYSKEATSAGHQDRLSFLDEQGMATGYLSGKKQFNDPEQVNGNIENFIGMAQIPVGLAGPLLVNGAEATGDFFVPLATTEGALVASYNRGMKACRESGGITAICLVEGVQRSPFFKFDNIVTAGSFVKWIHKHLDAFIEIVEKTSRFARLKEMKTKIEGNSVILTFEYTTGDAAGQNMVTICTHQVCRYILENFEVTPTEWYIESNYSGDKKATSLSFSNVRGKKVTCEIVLPRKVVAETLKTTPEKVSRYWQASTLAVTQSGSIGAQGHVANGLTALFIACGQDVACISEASVGSTRMEVNPNGDLYASVTLPSLIVGTIGGGTTLPTQMECLNMLGCAGIGKARKFAEICGAVALAGEISIAAAMAADHFTRAHQNLGRKKQ